MKITVPKILDLKSERQITMMTAYDFPTSKAVSEAQIDIILVGDSLAQVVLGHNDTLSVTMDEMLHHVRAVTRSKPNCLVVADMPYMSYHNTKEEAVKNAARFIQEGKADAVKLEGGFKRRDIIEAIISAEIPDVSKHKLSYDGTRAIDGGAAEFREGIASGGKAIKFRCFVTKENSAQFPNLVKFINELQSKETYETIQKWLTKIFLILMLE